MAQFGIKWTLPGPSSAEVAVQRLVVQWGADAPITTDYPPETAVSDEYIGELPATINVSLTDLDASGNESEVRTRAFSEVDDVAPPIPGEVTVAEKRQLP